MPIFPRVFLESCFALLLFGALDLLPIEFRFLFGIWLGFCVVSQAFDPVHKTLAMLSICLALLAVNWIAPHFMKETYYREHEILRKISDRGFKRYAPNQHVVIDHGHGDLLGVGFQNPDIHALLQERRLEFKGDAFGYRDYGGIEGIRAVLLGDSFVVGNSNTQEDNLSQILLERGIKTYNLGHNGDIAEYLRALENARVEIGIREPAVLFAFEGNDFAQINYCTAGESKISRIRDWHRAMKEQHISRFLAALGARFWAVLTTEENAAPVVQVVDTIPGGPKMGFLGEYMDAAVQKKYDFSCLRRLMEPKKRELAGIVFIPEKSRVYSFLVPGAAAELNGDSVYSRGLRGIAEDLRIPYIDLTEPLRERAHALLPQGKFVYWRDDTHWNREGMAVAAEKIIPLFNVPSSK